MTDTTIPQGQPALRRLSEGEADQFELTSYLLIARTHTCAACSAIQHYSDTFEVWTHPTKTALSKAKILKPATRIEPGFAIAHVVNPASAVPLCHECIETHDPRTTRVFPAVSYSAWADTLQRKALQVQADRREAAAKTARPTPTLDQL